MLIGFLLISRLPVWSGKSLGLNVRREFALPLMLLAVLSVALLVAYTWHVMIAGSALYLAALPRRPCLALKIRHAGDGRG
nr:hypothetical protein [Marinicella sp. W31]MDC2876771.1 hypothetical protein [Marinicella sp. W31]